MINKMQLRNYTRLLEKVKERNTFSQQKLAKHLGRSPRTIYSFLKGEKIDIWLLDDFAAINGYNLIIEL